MKRATLLFVLGAATTIATIGACDKDKPQPDGPITKSSDTPPATTTTASASVAITPSAAPSSSTATATTTASAIAVAGDAGKPSKDAGTSSATATTTLKPASKHVNGKNFALDVASPGCKATEECAMTIKLSAVGDYHVNKEYPYKFVAVPAPGVAFLGKSEPNTFTRTSGDFVEQGEKSGTMTVRFKPASAGDAKVSGTYKLSVCSADQCQIEQENVELVVPVM